MEELDDDSRRDLLVGREKRLREAYQETSGVLFRRLDWVAESQVDRRAHHLPTLTLDMYDRDVAGTFVATATKAEELLRAWLVARDELAALEGKR